jgi:hypothetical protein
MAILTCNCNNEHQDKLHGVGRRVFNKTAKQGGVWRCTVCLRERGRSDTVTVSKKKK